MKRVQLLLCSFVAMLMLSVNSAWAQYVKLTDENGMVSWIRIYGTINGENIKIHGGIDVGNHPYSAIDKNTKGSINLNEVWSESGGKGTHYQVTNIGDYVFYKCHGLTSVTIPSSVTSIGRNAFDNCDGLTSVDIPFGVTSIGGSAFGFCISLTSVVIPSSVTSIGGSAFTFCRSLTSIEIPSSVTSIGGSAFSSCISLTSIIIPSSVTSIGDFAFRGCRGLTSIVVESGNSVYDSRNNCNAIIETASNTLITGCNNTIIPSNVTSIEDCAFQGFSGLISIDIPFGVTNIGKRAFLGCSGLTSITSYLIKVFETGPDAFSECENATLYVQKGLVSTYQSTADWNRIKNIEEIPGIALAMSCNNKGKVKINGGVQFTNDMGEVSVYDGVDNTFIFQPNDNCELRQVLIDGLDVTLSVENNKLTAKVREGSKMIVVFDKSSSDVNGDGLVDISDVVKLVNIILGQ